jgi:hypothetical protein
MFLSLKQQNTFYTLLEQLFSNIDIGTIEAFNLSNIEEYIKRGWLNLYKHQTLSHQTIYIYRKNKKLYCIYYAEKKEDLNVLIDHVLYPISVSLEHTYFFGNKPFIHKYSFTIPIKPRQQQLTIQHNKSNIFIQTGKHKYPKTIPINKIYSQTIINLKEKLYHFIRTTLLGNKNG